MKTELAAVVCAAMGILASCSTPAERCNARIISEQRNVMQLLQDVEANIARGYSYEARPAQATGFDFCVGGFSRRSNRVGLGYSTCYGGGQSVSQRVAIDPTAELRKRDALRARLAALSQDGVPQCTGHERDL